jgi:hypothetical protein
VYWEDYPRLGRVAMGSVIIKLSPDTGGRHSPVYSPVVVAPAYGSAKTGFAGRNESGNILTEKVLVAAAGEIERPSDEFYGGVEIIEMADGIPLRSRVQIGKRVVAETEYLNGFPVSQMCDLDFDGRMETKRVLRVNNAARAEGFNLRERSAFSIVHSESDWDGDGEYEDVKDY